MSLTLENLTLTGGRANTFGGAVWSFGALSIIGCTFTDNTAGEEGGAIQTWGGSPLLRVTNSTFVDNAAPKGSAIGTGALTSSLNHVRITGNTANGTLWVWQTNLVLRNSIVAGNTNDGATTNGGNGSGTLAGSNNNLLGGGTWTGIADGTSGIAPA